MNDSLVKTFAVALGLCVVCSVLVSSAAVVLKPVQERNKLLDKQRNILVAAGLLTPREAAPASVIQERFKTIRPVVIDLATGDELDGVDATTLDTRKESADPAQSRTVGSGDTAKIRRVPNRAAIYLAEKEGRVERYIFPIHGKGLWSTMYGFVALEADLDTVAGLTFYDHGETPGLGGEIANPTWQKKWNSKKVYAGEPGEVELTVVRHGTPNTSDHQVDGIAGATLTCNGVAGTIHFWLGEHGYGKYIAKAHTTSKQP